MSIQPIGVDDIEGFTLQVHPSRTFSSSSAGISGSVNLFARHSTIQKEVQPLSPFLDVMHNDQNLQLILNAAQQSTSSDISAFMIAYMSGVDAQSVSPRIQKQLEIIRFEPSVLFTADTERKNVIRNVLYPYYRHTYPGAHWAYTNYHSLNFFTASSVPSNTVLLYPNVTPNGIDVIDSGAYRLDDKFTFEFYINPRYTTDDQTSEFHAGTIFHLSSSYAVSLVSGSSRDQTGRPDGFRLLLQVLGGADTRPSLVTTSSNLIFLSDDNALRLNHWHRVAIRWGASFNDHTGSFIIDGTEAGTFVIPHESIKQLTVSGADVLCVGNYYEGNNTGNNSMALFFNQNISIREGLVQLVDDGDSTTNTPDTFLFRHPLNAEIHELKIHTRVVPTELIDSSESRGLTSFDDVSFYVPPFFTRESPNRRPYGSNANGWIIGGVMQTPFESAVGSTIDPFNIALSFGVDGLLMNLENFTREFITGNYPRLLHLSATEIGVTEQIPLTADQLLYDEVTFFNSGSVRKRNVTVLPNDNGLFFPNFKLLQSGVAINQPASGSIHDRYVNDLGNIDLSLISINNLFPTASALPGLGILDPITSSILSAIVGASPENPSLVPGDIYTVFQRTLDPSSNEVVFFDVSNMFYGNRIYPKSLILTDSSITGTAGRVGITLRDNGYGGLYRADCLTPQATWNNVGDVFYNEGIVVVKTPGLHFGRDQFSIEFKGEQNIHIMRLNVIARSGEINSSSNPTFIPISASNLAHETDAEFVYLTGLNIHDEDLNVIMKTRFAQPVIKRNSDRYLVKIRVDF